jgi:hypothetical protein
MIPFHFAYTLALLTLIVREHPALKPNHASQQLLDGWAALTAVGLVNAVVGAHHGEDTGFDST